MDPKELLLRLSKLKARRQNFDTLFQQVKDVVWPNSADFIVERTPGDKTNRKIFDMTAALALETFASAMESFLVPRHLRWHGLNASDEKVNKDPEVREFLEKTTKFLRRLTPGFTGSSMKG